MTAAQLNPAAADQGHRRERANVGGLALRDNLESDLDVDLGMQVHRHRVGADGLDV